MQRPPTPQSKMHVGPSWSRTLLNKKLKPAALIATGPDAPLQRCNFPLTCAGLSAGKQPRALIARFYCVSGKHSLYGSEPSRASPQHSDRRGKQTERAVCKQLVQSELMEKLSGVSPALGDGGQKNISPPIH